MQQNIKDKLKRLYELAKRGDQHEAETAKRLLDEQLSKWAISLQDLTDEEEKQYEIRFKTEMDESLICQIAGSLNMKTYQYNNKRKIVVLKCTTMQYAEFSQRYDFYFDLFKEELRLFYIAFLHKHNIFKPKDENEEPQSDKKTSLSLEQIQQLYQMIKSMKDKTFLTKIGNENS